MPTNRAVITPGSRPLSQQTREEENRLSGSNEPQKPAFEFTMSRSAELDLSSTMSH